MIKRPTDEAKAVARLPRWAQFKIQKLTADAEYWRAKIEPMTVGKSNVMLTDALERRGLPMDSRLIFLLDGEPEDYRREVHVNLSADRRSLEIRLDNLLIQAEANNCIRVLRGK